MSTYKDERGDTVSSVEAQKVVETTPVQARQGLLGRPVLMVLIGGLVLAIVALLMTGAILRNVRSSDWLRRTPL